MRNLKDRVVVITGAASGIGRATALRFAKRGARLALIDINAKGLESLIYSIKEMGGEGICFTIDVTDLDSLKTGASRIASHYGRIDVWINNAGVAVYGEFHKIPPEDFKRVIDVNFFGHVNGVYAALPYLEHSNSSGVLLGTVSVLGEATAPLQTPYVSSKFSLMGFYGSFYEELIHRRSKIKIGTILPASVATPFFSHAKTFLGVEPKPFPPAFSPELIAEKYEKAALDPRLDIVAGSVGHLYIRLYRYFRPIFHPVQAYLGYFFQRSLNTKAINEKNNLFLEILERGSVRDRRYKYIPYVFSIGAKAILPLVAALAIANIYTASKKGGG